MGQINAHLNTGNHYDLAHHYNISTGKCPVCREHHFQCPSCHQWHGLYPLVPGKDPSPEDHNLFHTAGLICYCDFDPAEENPESRGFIDTVIDPANVPSPAQEPEAPAEPTQEHQELELEHLAAAQPSDDGADVPAEEPASPAD